MLIARRRLLQKTYKYDVPIVSLSYSNMPSDGGELIPSYSYSQTIHCSDGTSETITNSGELSWSISNKLSGVTFDTSTGYITCSANEDTTQKTLGVVTLSVTLNGETGSTTCTVYQTGADEPVITYSEPTVSLTYTDAASTKGSTATPTCTYTQIRYSNGVEDSTITTGGNLTYSINTTYDSTITYNSTTGVVTTGQDNTSTSRVALCIMKASVTLNGETGSTTCTVYQTGADEPVITYGKPVVNLEYNNDIPANGGTSSATASFIQKRYSDGVEDGEYTQSDGNYTAIYSIDNKLDSNVSINSSNGTVTYNNENTGDRRRVCVSSLEVNARGETGTGTCEVYQEEGEEPESEIKYDDPIVRLYYDTIDADGGSASPHLTVTQTYTDENGEMHTVDNLLYNTSYSIKSSDYGATINSIRGTVTMEQVNDTYEERVVAVVECVVTANSKEATVTADVQQEAKEYGITPDSVTVVIEAPVITVNEATYKVNAEIEVHKDGAIIDTFYLTDDDIDDKLYYNHITLVWGWEGNDILLSNYTDSDVVGADKPVSDYVDFDTDKGTVYIFFPISHANTTIPLGTATLSITNINRQEVMYGQNSIGLSWDAR